MATSKLQIAVGNILDKSFPEYTIRENYRPDWLVSSNSTKLELDFYIEELKIAIEVQGKQHYEFIEFFFKSEDEFEKIKRYDREKIDLCYRRGVALHEVFSFMDALLLVKSIKEKTSITNGYATPSSSVRWFAKAQKKAIVSNPVYIYWKKIIYQYDFSQEKDDKMEETNKYYKKLTHFFKNGVNLKHKLPLFNFEFLNCEEQEALIEEVKQQIKIFNAYAGGKL